MSGHTHSLAEWLQMFCLSVAIFEACSVPYFLLVDADLDPRPVLRRCHQAAVHVSHDLNWAYASCLHVVRDASAYARLAARDAALTVAALLALLTLEHAR